MKLSPTRRELIDIIVSHKIKRLYKEAADLRTLAKAAGTDPQKPSALIGKSVSGNAVKAKSGKRMYLNF